MPKTNKNRKIPGGRAQYTGKNAYASQGFENDTRVEQLSGLAYCYLAGNLVLTSTSQTIVWGKTVGAAGFNNIFTRGFTLLSDGATLSCLTPGTYRIDSSLQLYVQATQTGTIFATVKRAGTILFQAQGLFQASTTQQQTTLTTVPFIFDLKAGDQISLILAAAISTTVLGGFGPSTGLMIQAVT